MTHHQEQAGRIREARPVCFGSREPGAVQGNRSMMPRDLLAESQHRLVPRALFIYLVLIWLMLVWADIDARDAGFRYLSRLLC